MMDRTERYVVISMLTDALREHGSWAGETHLQKATFLLQELAGVDLGFEFVPYKHGPFAFDLRTELNSMLSDGLLELETRPYPYGPSFSTTKSSRKLMEVLSTTASRFQRQVSLVANGVGETGVAELERLGTTLYLIRQRPQDDSSDIARQLRELKPHVDQASALSAVEKIRRLLKEAVPGQS